MYFIVQGLSGGRPGCANPNLSSWWIEGDLKVFKRVTSKCLTSMYAFTCRFPKSTVGGFFVFIDRYPCIRALRRLVCAILVEALPFWLGPTPREIRLSYSYQYLSIRDVAENRSSLMYTDLL